MKLYMFRAVSLSIIRSFSLYTQQWCMSYWFADSLRAGSGWNATRCTNFSNLFLEWNSTCFGQFLCPSPGVFHCTHSNGICHTGLLTACEQDQNVPSWSCSQAVSKPVWHIPLLCVQWKTPDDARSHGRQMYEVIGDKYMYWTYCMRLVGIKRGKRKGECLLCGTNWTLNP